MLNCVKGFFCIGWDYHMVFIFQFVNMPFYSSTGESHSLPNWFSAVVTSKPFWEGNRQEVFTKNYRFFFLVIDIYSHSIVIREDAWYDCNFLKFTEFWFVTQDVVYPGECSMCTWKEGIFYIWMECSKISMRSISSNVSFKTCVSLLIFCFDDLSIGLSGVLKSPTIIVLLSISPFMSVSVCLMYWGAPMLGT